MKPEDYYADAEDQLKRANATLPAVTDPNTRAMLQYMDALTRATLAASARATPVRASGPASPAAILPLLRFARRNAGLTGEVLAQMLNWSQTKVSRVENNGTGLTRGDVRLWLRACGANDEAITDAVINYDAAETDINPPRKGWHDDTGSGYSDRTEREEPDVQRDQRIG